MEGFSGVWIEIDRMRTRSRLVRESWKPKINHGFVQVGGFDCHKVRPSILPLRGAPSLAPAKTELNEAKPGIPPSLFPGAPTQFAGPGRIDFPILLASKYSNGCWPCHEAGLAMQVNGEM